MKKQNALIAITSFILGHLYINFFAPVSMALYLFFIFNILFVVLCWFFIGPSSLISKISSKNYVLIFAFFVLGFVLFKLGAALNVPIPYDFDNALTNVYLVLIAPPLEELIFRSSLWNAVKLLTQKFALVLTTTAVLFMLLHAVAYFFIPDEYKPFILYQSGLALFYGLVFGWAREKTNALLLPILLHLALNLGFGISSQLIF